MRAKKSTPKAAYGIVMLIDDSDIDNYINERMIKAFHFAEKIYINTGTKSGVEFLKNIATAENSEVLFPDIIFLDINMPLMDGFTFVEEYDKLTLPQKNTEIIMLTSSLNPDDELKSKNYPSISSFVRKPLTEMILKSLLKQESV